jgi:diadenosine tetraphosphatase ApaH/serine/threonine PP2A family protein phosphatase
MFTRKSNAETTRSNTTPPPPTNTINTTTSSPYKSPNALSHKKSPTGGKPGSLTTKKNPGVGGSKKPSIVTMNDLFGPGGAGKISAPVIDIGSAYDHNTNNQLPEVFSEASDYVEYSFGNSDLDVSPSNIKTRASAKSVLGVSSSPATSRKTTGGQVLSNGNVVVQKSLFGNRNTKTNKKNSKNNNNNTGALKPMVISNSSFEAVFDANNNSKKNSNQQNGGGGGDDFEMENPFKQAMHSEVKEAATKVLYAQNESIEDKARKLFLLDQLNKPAPPVVPPRLMDDEGSSFSDTSSIASSQSSNSNFGGRKTGIKKKRGVARTYDPNATALGIKGGSSGYFSLLQICCTLSSSTLEMGWRIRVEIMRDVADQLCRLLDTNRVHNSIDTPGSVLITADSIRGTLCDDKGTICGVLKTEDPESRGKIMRDVVCFGALMLQVAIRPPNLSKECGTFVKMITAEKECTNKSHFMNIDDTLFSMQETSDREVREALARSMAPGSLLELIAQCCSGDRMTRPAIKDVWDWLDSIIGDMDKADKGKDPLPSDLSDNISIQLKKISSLTLIKKPKLPDISVIYLQEELPGYDSDATGKSGLSGYSSDDSYQPTSDKAKETEEKRKSKLLDFLSTAATNDASTKQQRPQSLNLNSSSGGKSLTDFLSTSTDTAMVAGLEAKDQERNRRRSLDRGYMWAKQKFATPVETSTPTNATTTTTTITTTSSSGANNNNNNNNTAGNRVSFNMKKVAQESTNQFKEQWNVAQSSAKARKPEEVAELFKSQMRLAQDEALAIIKKAEAIMKKEPNLLELKPPIIIVGDIHGQFFDLLNMMQKAGLPGQKKTGKTSSFVFLGDYVDRGDFSCEVLLYLLSLKGEYPDQIYLLRGNHECRTVSSYFGFKEEAEVKYGLTVFNKCMSVFQAMPMAALIETQAGRFLCCHGGISPNITSLAQFAEYDRFIEPGMNGFLCDLLWSDPIKDAHEDGSDMSLGDFLSIDYLPNPARGCSYRYGFKALVSFLAVNKLVALVRAHEVMQAGFKYHFQDITGGAKAKTAHNVMPPVITVFSAPNYCNKYGNKGAFLRLHAHPPFQKPPKGKSKGAGFKPLELLEPVQFDDVPHPPPMQYRNEQAEQQAQITSACPYMPTTFHAFIKRALELAQKAEDEYLEEKAREEAAKALAPVPIPKKRAGSKDLDDSLRDAEEVALEEKLAKHQSLGAKVLKTVSSLAKMKLPLEDTPEETKTKADLAAKKNWKALQQLGLDQPTTSELPRGKTHINAQEREATEKFDKAMEHDGVNEMNPVLLEEKIAKAKQKITEKKLDQAEETSIFVAASSDSPTLSSTVGRKTLTERKRSSQRLIVGDKLRPESVRGPGNLAKVDETSVPKKVEEEMTFNSRELLALQMLFLLVDRADKGFLSVEDLIAWSAEEGYAVAEEEANVCLKMVDADEDGKIGFEDYLAFAARSKDQWLVNEYKGVLSQVADLRRQRTNTAPDI